MSWEKPTEPKLGKFRNTPIGCYCGTKAKDMCLRCKHVCCTDAVTESCVCLISFKCSTHTGNYTQCIGSHE